MVKPYNDTTLPNFPEISERQQILLQGSNITVWNSNSNEENNQNLHQQILRSHSSGQRRSNSGKLATKIKRSVLSLVSSTNQNSVRTEGGLMMDDSCASSEVGFSGGGIDPFEVAIPMNKRTSYSFPIANPITPSPTLHQGSNETGEISLEGEYKVKQPMINMTTLVEQHNPHEDSKNNASNPSNFIFNPFDVTPENTFIDFSNSQNIITPLKLWPNDSSYDLTLTIADDTSPTTIIQPEQLELSKTLQRTKSSLLFEDLTASEFHRRTDIGSKKHANKNKPIVENILGRTVTHEKPGNTTKTLSKVYNPSTVESKKDMDVCHPTFMENFFCTNHVEENGTSTAAIPTNNTRSYALDTKGTKNSITLNMTIGDAPSTEDSRSVIVKQRDLTGHKDVIQDVLATSTISTTSIENGFAVKGRKDVSKAETVKTVSRPKRATNDPSADNSPYYTVKDGGKSMKGEEKAFLLSAGAIATTPTKPVFIDVLHKDSQTLSPCSQLVEIEVKQTLDVGVAADSPIKIKEDISVIDADVSDGFHYIDITSFATTPAKNLNASDFESYLQLKLHPVDVTSEAATNYMDENNLIGGTRVNVNAVSSILRSACDTPTSEKNSNRNDDGVLIQFRQEPKKNDKRVKFQEKPSVHILYHEEGINQGKSSSTTLDGIRSTLQYILRSIMNCAEASTMPNTYQEMPHASSLQNHYYMNEQSILDDVGYEVHLNDSGDESKHKMQQVDSLPTTAKQKNLAEEKRKVSHHFKDVETSSYKTATLSIVLNECNNNTETSSQHGKEPSYSSFNGHNRDVHADQRTTSNDEQGSKSSMKRIGDLFDACHSPDMLEIEHSRSHQKRRGFNSTIEAPGGFHTPVRQDPPEENATTTNPSEPTKHCTDDKKKPKTKSLTSLIEGCQYPVSSDSDDDVMVAEDYLYSNSHSNVLQGFHTPNHRDMRDAELINNSKSTEKRSNVNKKWLRKTTLGAVFDVCGSPLEYSKDDVSEPSSVSFSPVNEPPLFVDVPTFQELSVIPEEKSNSFSAILEDLEGVALMATTPRGFNSPLQHQGSSSSSSRKKRMSSGKLSTRSRINSCLESKYSSNNSTISTIQSWTDSFSTTKLSPSQDDSSVAVDKSSILNTALSDDPQTSITYGVKSMHNSAKESFELESEPGHLPISRLRVGIRPLLQLHLDAASLSTKTPPTGSCKGLYEKFERDRPISKYRSTSIRAQARSILEQRRYNMRRTRSESNISTPTEFDGGKKSESLKQATEDCFGQEEAPLSSSLDNNVDKQKEDTNSSHSQKRQIEGRPHNNIDTSPEVVDQRSVSLKRKPAVSSSEGAKALLRSHGQGDSRLTSIKNNVKHDIVRTASGSDWEFKQRNLIPNNGADLQEHAITNLYTSERPMQQKALYQEKYSKDKDETESTLSDAKTSLRSNVHCISIPFTVKDKEEDTVHPMGELKNPHFLTARRSLQLDETTITGKQDQKATADVDSTDDYLENSITTKQTTVYTSSIKQKIAMFEKKNEPLLK